MLSIPVLRRWGGETGEGILFSHNLTFIVNKENTNYFIYKSYEVLNQAQEHNAINSSLPIYLFVGTVFRNKSYCISNILSYLPSYYKVLLLGI